MSHPPTRALLSRIASGDADAVQECIDRYGGLVWSLARRFLSNTAEAEDAVQDVFIELWRSAARFDADKASEPTFVAMVARRRIIDRLRKVGRRLDTRSVEEEVHEPADDSHDRLERGAEAMMAQRAFRELPEVRQRVLTLSIYQGMSHREIAEATSMPIGTVKSHITRGLAHVRERLLGDDATGGTA